MPESKLNGKTVLMVIPPTQFREEEFFEPKRLVEMEGAKVVVGSTAVRTCYGMKGGTVNSEIAIADAKQENYQGLVLCGGSSVPELFWNDKKLAELVTGFATAGKMIAAICLSTVVLAKAKLLADKDATVYFLPQAIHELKAAGAKYAKQPLIVHSNIIVAEGPPESTRFGQAICAALVNGSF